MSILSTELVGHSFNDTWLFKDLTFGLVRGQKIALVGVNGAGKSTLLKIIAGLLVPQKGKVVKEKGLKIGYLEQNPDFQGNELVADYIYSFDNHSQTLIRKYEELIDNENVSSDELESIINEISDLNAWEYEHQIKSILSQLSIKNLEQRIETLSGGQRKRLALAKLLIDEPDVYILDEPTNHLDIEMIEWLERFISFGSKTIVMVTHDRYFLDNVCNRIMEIADQTFYNYNGNYTYFLQKKSERAQDEASTLQKNNNLLKKELEWMRRQPQARATKSKARIDAFYDLKDKTTKGSASEKLKLEISVSRQGKNILEVRNITKSYATPIVNNFSYTFKKGDKIGIAGSNGSGKSTLLNMLTGALSPDRGEIIKGETTVFGYYRQDGLSFQKDEKVIDIVKNVAEYITVANSSLLSASQLLTHFLFPPARQYGPVSKLSGGELKRLNLMKVLMANPNFLILDEPTNDLDLDTLNVLEDFLESYSGVLLLVSHDRYLMDRLCDQLFILQDGNVQIYNGNYSDYRLQETKTETVQVKAPVQEKVKATKSSLSFKEQKELEGLGKEIENAEAELNTLTEALNSITEFERLSELSNTIAKLRSEIEQKSERWLLLSEMA